MTTRLTPFAETMILRRENNRLREELLQIGLGQAANEAEARGALMLICVLVENSSTGELRIPMADLVAAHGRVRRTLDQETNEVVFTVAPDEPSEDEASRDNPPSDGVASPDIGPEGRSNPPGADVSLETQTSSP